MLKILSLVVLLFTYSNGVNNFTIINFKTDDNANSNIKIIETNE